LITLATDKKLLGTCFSSGSRVLEFISEYFYIKYLKKTFFMVHHELLHTSLVTVKSSFEAEASD
jgi:hypothetical protein